MSDWSPETIAEFFSQTDLFQDLPPEVCKLLATDAEVQHAPAGQMIFSRGAEGNSLYVLAEGQVRVSLEGPDGEEAVSVLEQGNFFGEIAMLTHSHRTASITATAETTLLVLSAEQVLPVTEQYQAFRTRLGRTGAKRSQESIKRMLGE
jgi:CRP-like cAMP-binding protein